MMNKTLMSMLIAVGLLTAGTQANLLENPGFELMPNASSPVSANYHLPTFPVTVDSSDSNFTDFIGRWARMGAAGNGFTTPAGTGNDSNRATSNRKAGRYTQILPLGTVSAGQDLLLDWQYVVATSFNDANSGAGQEVTFTAQVVGLNEGDPAGAATTFTSGWGFGSTAAGNAAILGSITVTIPAGTADGIWKDAPQTLIEVNDQWDYIAVSIKRGSGLTNSTGAQTDNMSLAFVPEPASLALLGLGGLVMLARRR